MTTTINTRTMTLCGLFSALCAIGAFIQVPVPFMDYFTLQFLFVLLAGMLLGPKRGSLSIGVYVLVGLAGIPIFAAGGGISYVLRPSFGYLLGFIAAAWVTGALSKRSSNPSFKHFFPAALAGMAVTYSIGFLYKYLILNYYVGQPTPLAVVFLSAFPLDLPGDFILCILASMMAGRLSSILQREGLV